MQTSESIQLTAGDALLLVDLQNDFLPGGALAISDGDRVVPVLNRYLQQFRARQLPVFATRDWHPPNHCSFQAQGGPWPPHCVRHSPGAAFAPQLALSDRDSVVSKAETAERDAYSGFSGTDLAERLRQQGCRRLFVGGLATDYCVLNTVLDGLKAGFSVMLLKDAIRAVDQAPGDGERAIEQMAQAGARVIEYGDLDHGAH